MKFKKKSSIKNVIFGKNVTVVEPVNLYDCQISDNCFIGPFVEIQSNVFIAKIQEFKVTLLYVQSKIGKNCFIGHGVTFK